jgi:threonine/homoserine/homoserine lactone efflux protein
MAMRVPTGSVLSCRTLEYWSFVDSTLPSLIGFAIAMYITPGPNNAMLAASGASFGMRAAVPHMLGIVCGFAFMMTVVTAGVASIVLTVPLLLPLMRWGGAAWMLVLAWKIATAQPPNTTITRGRGRVLGFGGAAAFQWVNPKGWLIALAAAGTFIRPGQDLWTQTTWISIVFFVVALPCMLPWVLLGAGAGRVLRSPGRLRAFNIVMALLLVASVVPLLLD